MATATVEPQMIRALSWIVICTLVSSAVPVWSSAGGAGEAPDPYREFDGLSPQDVLELLAAELSDSLPLRIDDQTRLTSIEVEDGGLVYGYASDVTEKETRVLARQRRPMIEAMACRNPLHGSLLLDGRVIRYVYAVDGVVVAEILVSLKACELSPDGTGQVVDA